MMFILLRIRPDDGVTSETGHLNKMTNQGFLVIVIFILITVNIYISFTFQLGKQISLFLKCLKNIF